MAMSRYSRALLLLMVAALIGCGGGATSQKSSPPQTGTGTITTTPGSLAVSAPTLDFGNVAVGSSTARTVTLAASGSAVTISSGDWSGSGFSVSGITFPLVLKAGESASFTVTFAAQTSGSASGNISFISNAANSPTAEAWTAVGTQAAMHSVSLFWDPSPSQVIGYNVYRGTKSGGPYPVKLNASPQPTTAFVDNTVATGTTYYYVATSVDTDSVESVYSNEIIGVVP